MPELAPSGAAAQRSLRDLGTAPTAPDPAWRFRRRLGPVRVARELWAARELVRTLAERDIRVRYKQAALGLAWSLITPLALLVAFTILFNRAAHVATDGVPYTLFAYVGLIPWTFFSSTVGAGSSSLIGDQALLNKTYFPREIFPVNAAVVAGFDALTSLVPLAVLLAVHRRTPGAEVLWAPVILIVLAAAAVGLALIASSLVVYLRDVRLALPLVLQMGLFLTPVGYDISVIPARLRLPYAFLDPVAPVIAGLRNSVLLDRAPDLGLLGAGAASASLLFFGGWALFKRLETGFADVV